MKYAKAVTAAVVAGAGTLGSALADNQVESGEVLAVVLAVLAALGIVAKVPNKE